MSDLIWIGNTLYPRWIVLLALALTVAAIVGISMAIASGIREGQV